MAGTVKKLQFSEGTDVGAPSDLSLQTSTSVIAAYANDAAYVVANGPAANGGVYLNSTLGQFRYYLTSWRNAVPESDLSDPTKTFLVDSTGNTTGVSSTLDFNNTANRIYTYPNYSGTLATIAGTETLTNKTLTSPTLTTALIAGGTLDVSAAGNVTIGASVGANNLTLGGAASTVIIAGDLIVQGTQVILNTTTLDVEDPNITVNKGGNDASAEGAGLTVQRTATNGSLVYQNSLLSKWKIGLLGAELEVVDVSSGQTINNKLLGSANRFTSSILLTEIATPSTPAAGFLKIYPKTDKKMYQLDSTGLEKVLGGGGGSGEKNYVANPNDANANWFTSGAGITVTTESTPSNLADNISQTTGIKITRVSGTDYAYTRFTLDKIDYGKLLKVVKDLAYGGNAGDYTVKVFSNTLANYTGTSTELPLNFNNLPSGVLVAGMTFTSSNAIAPYLELRITGVAGTTPLYLNNVLVGPGTNGSIQGRSQNLSYTPTFSAVGTPISVFITYARDNEDMIIEGRLVTGTATGVANRISLPSGYTVDFTKRGTTFRVGDCTLAGGSANALGVNSAIASDSFYIAADTAIQTAAIGNAAIGSGTLITFNARIPIAEWASSGSVNIGAGAQVEYAYNTSTSTTADNTTSFANGSEGALIQNITASHKRRVRFSTPIQSDDLIEIQVSEDRLKWVAMDSYFINAAETFNLGPYTVQNGISYGFGRRAIVNTTDVDIYFGTYALSVGAFAAVGQAWSTGQGGLYWRARKVRASSPVGFGLAAATESGLLKQYVEGTFSPIFASTGTQPATTYTTQVGEYTKIGDFVHFSLRLTSNTFSSGGTGNVLISGLPFVSKNTIFKSCVVGYSGAFSANQNPTQALVRPNSSIIEIYYKTGTNTNSIDLPVAAFSSGCDLMISGSYKAVS